MDWTVVATWQTILHTASTFVLAIAALLAVVSVMLVTGARSTQTTSRQILAACGVLVWLGALVWCSYDGFGSPPGYVFALIVVTVCVVSAGQLLVELLRAPDPLDEQFRTIVFRLTRRAAGVTIVILIFRAVTSGSMFEDLAREEGLVVSLMNVVSDDTENIGPALLFLYALFLTPYVVARWLLVRYARKAGIVVPRYTNWLAAAVSAVLLIALLLVVLASEDEPEEVIGTYFDSFWALSAGLTILGLLCFDFIWDRSVGLITLARRRSRAPKAPGPAES